MMSHLAWNKNNMEIDVATGMLCDVRYVPSPNYNERPTDTVIDLLVIHNISLPPGEFGGPPRDRRTTARYHPYLGRLHARRGPGLRARRCLGCYPVVAFPPDPATGMDRSCPIPRESIAPSFARRYA